MSLQVLSRYFGPFMGRAKVRSRPENFGVLGPETPISIS